MIAPYERISFECATKDVAIYYTTDGTRPTSRSKRYASPFTLSLATGMEVRALAVAPDGQIAESSRRYHFDEVGSVEDFFVNGPTSDPVTISGKFQLVFKDADDAYFLDLLSQTSDYLYATGGSTYLSRVAVGDIVSSIRAFAATDGGMDVASIAAALRNTSKAELPEPQTVSLRQINDNLIHHLITVRGRIDGSVIDEGSHSLAIDERYTAISPSDRQRDVAATGFLAKDIRGGYELRLTGVEREGEPDVPDTPDNPEGKLSSLRSMAIGPGKVEIFPGINRHTKTPEGELLASEATVMVGDTVYAYFLPEEGYSLASIVVNTTAYDGASRALTETVYGKMLPIAVESDVTVIATFAASSTLEVTPCDPVGSAIYFDLFGRQLGTSRPLQPGLYIVKEGSESRIVRIAD